MNKGHVASVMQAALRRERVIVVAMVLGVASLCWAYLLAGAGTMQEMGGMLMPMTSWPWTLSQTAVMFVMWTAMMMAMMLPSATPMILFYTTIARKRRENGEQAASPVFFALGYVLVWTAFSAAAVALQYGLESATLLSPMMQTSSLVLAGALLAGAGIYQWLPLKQACLRHCRSPLEFVLACWREGAGGALVMGIRHGMYCVGCCWVLMLLLFVVGVMNTAWIAGLALYVMAEKLFPAGHWIGRTAGVLLVAWGGATLLAA